MAKIKWDKLSSDAKSTFINALMESAYGQAMLLKNKGNSPWYFFETEFNSNFDVWCDQNWLDKNPWFTDTTLPQYEKQYGFGFYESYPVTVTPEGDITINNNTPPPPPKKEESWLIKNKTLVIIIIVVAAIAGYIIYLKYRKK